MTELDACVLMEFLYLLQVRIGFSTGYDEMRIFLHKHRDGGAKLVAVQADGTELERLLRR